MQSLLLYIQGDREGQRADRSDKRDHIFESRSPPKNAIREPQLVRDLANFLVSINLVAWLVMPTRLCNAGSRGYLYPAPFKFGLLWVITLYLRREPRMSRYTRLWLLGVSCESPSRCITHYVAHGHQARRSGPYVTERVSRPPVEGM